MTDQRDGDLVIRVCKRDGSIEPFELSKLLSCIRNGFQSAGESVGAGTMRGLAEAVFEFLRRSKPPAPVPSQQIAELADMVLTQTDHTAAGMAVRQHGYLRDQQRRRVVVASPRASDGRYVHRRWSKGRLVQYLKQRQGLDTPAARMVAGRVEQLIFGCGLRVVTAGLVLEMTRSELMAWGLLSDALAVKQGRTRRAAGKVTDRSNTS